jgi:GDPmannose 4,6-dehydratase
MRTAVITGVSGQDGSYLAELLVEYGYRVVGTSRDPAGCAGGIEIVEWDVRSQDRIQQIISAFRPDEIYNFAGLSSGAGMFDAPVEIGDVNGLSVGRILEAIRLSGYPVRFCQASSSEMFGDPVESPQSEDSSFRPRTPYGAAKLYAHWMIGVYRRRFGLFACSAILFNHESPRRRLEFVTRKITNGAASIKAGHATELRLGDLEARRDWGFAGDYVRAMWLMLQQPQPDDFVIATGETHSVRDVCEVAFRHLGLDYTLFVREEPAFQRSAETVQLVGRPDKARRALGWKCTSTFHELIQSMTESDSLRESRAIGHEQR